MWACWLLRFLLDEVKQLVPPAAVRSRTVFDSLLRYVTTTGAPFKHQVVSLLTQLLSSPELFARDALPDFGRFVSLERVVLAAIESHRASGSVFLPWKLQQLVEMCAMARFSMRCCNESRPARQAFDAARDIVVPSRIAFLSSPKLRVPVVRPAVLNLLTDNPVAAMVDLMDMSECLVLNARLPDRFTAAIGAIAAGLEPEDPKQLVRMPVVRLQVFFKFITFSGSFCRSWMMSSS